ncbi:type IV pilus modification protein PilV [Pseudoalteromonas phenolica]|uniref:Putative type IV pilus biogenesis protein membrane protein n=1 Tax=Pseudoalteromonas phenolica TaxID=161398 RepID=A0A0S2JZZ3_9GAMM|nr:type IV pilus modification protein PilV [Pseudoalteromonas phenolica]ALO41378.1 Putative type IV pilus biogenesis protein membrane protein [Pseudoalteromonas phenolica]MBE0354078.1 type IV pilus assembly protein PilV [Pseudoalteromonas phenolica O-BC30]RXE96380.1 type IV pilus modification protein PilV [Pseudoalteromonas phenolica O-BC30]TMO54787.1 type IV pilus modification protein PilV [Pseudoalteromonas phenolica]
MPSINRTQSGFTLLEVLIAFMVLSFGLLGAVALQAQAKKASFDSMQRAAAISLGEDIMQRIRSNDTTNIVNLYSQTFSSTTDLKSINTCYTDTCTAQNIALTDIENWKAAIRARENTGSLDEATVCINITPASNDADNIEFDVRVIVSWRGRQDLKASDAVANIQCGDENDRRRLVMLESYLLIRG